MTECAICGIEGATYAMISPEGKDVMLCEECHQSCGDEYQEKE